MNLIERARIGTLFLATCFALIAGASSEIDGTTVVFDTSDKAFGRALANLRPERFPQMLEGKVVFVHRFGSSGSGPEGLDGLGPLYVADSCAACHFKDGRGKDGRGRRSEDRPALHPPMIFRLGPHPAPSLGIQLQDQALGIKDEGLGLAAEGFAAEGRVQISYYEEHGRYDDGTTYSLRRPEYRLVTSPTRAPEDLPTLSPRIPPTLIGMGLLEAISSAEILAWADPDDTDGDGISGRPNWIAGPLGAQLGRFGWKAEQATLEDQVTAALAEDMGIDATSQSPEIAPRHLQRLITYLRLLAPPARRDVDQPEVLRGEQVFFDVGCAACHRPELRTGPADQIPGPPELASQSIYPYTDLLLHDMGDGQEWRTSPLWGLGLLNQVNGETFFLHDGRARTFEEAILWHGGEADMARDGFRSLRAPDRAALFLFLKSL